jgi:electron transfer flavoprotein beta subunit
MLIAVCVKHEMDPSGPFSLTEETSSLDGMGMVPITNPADRTALALVRSFFPVETAKVIALSVGPKSSECALRECLSLGADDAIRVWDDKFSGNPPGGAGVARVLSCLIASLGFDLVVCGSHSLGGASGYVGPAIAEALDFAQVSSVTHVELLADGTGLLLHRRLDRGDREIVVCQLPAVLTVDDGAVEIPYAPFPHLLAAERRSIVVRDLASLGLKPADVQSPDGAQLNQYISPRPRTKKSAAPEKALTPMQLMQQAMGGGGAKKNSNVVEGEPKKAAAEIVRFLASNGLL